MPPTVQFSEVLDYCDSIKRDRSDRTREIGLNREYYRAVNQRHYDQYLKGPNGRVIRKRNPPLRADEVRYTMHLAKATVDRVVAAVGLTPVQFFGIPATPAVEDRISAHMTTAFFQHLRYGDTPIDMMTLRRRETLAASIEGTTLMKFGFDVSAGDAIDIPPEVYVTLTPEQQERARKTGASWQVPMSYDNVLFPPWAQSWDQVPMVVEERAITVAELLRKFPAGSKEHAIVLENMRQRSANRDMTTYLRMQDTRDPQSFFWKHNYVAREVWIPPHGAFGWGPGTGANGIREFPDGHYQFWLEDQLIVEEKNPWARFGIKFPYVAVCHSDDPEKNEMEGIALMSMLRGQVPYIEALIGRTIERELKSANPIIMAPEGAVDRKKFMERQPNELVTYNHQMGKLEVVHPVGASPMSAGLASELVGFLADEMGAKPSGGMGMPKRVESGEGIRAVLEHDLSRLETIHDSIDESFRKVLDYRRILETNLAVGNRVLKIFARYELADILDWNPNDMGRSSGVYRASSPTIAYSPAVLEQRVLGYLQAGLMTLDEARERLEMPPAEGQGFGTRAEDSAIARQENRLIVAGHPEMAETLPVYDPQVHVQTHRLYLLQHRWDLSQEQISALLEHISVHEQQMQQAMMQQVQMQALASGKDLTQLGG